jgi:UDP-N-acetylmuramyl pentapeptide synthase
LNKITLEELGNITPILSLNNVKPNTEFDYFRIVKYNDDKVIKTKEHVLYFPITIASKDLKTGWYTKELDLKQYIVNIANNNPEYTYVIEPDMVKQLNNKVSYIVVNNIMDSIEDLFKYVLAQYKGKVICVTGSVGKTTTVGFIKQVLGNKCLRIYSKRITPLVLKCFCINYLTNEYDYLALEASLWYKEHITYFSKTLKPDLSIILDVFEEHIGVGDIKTISDITKFKSLLLQYSKNAIIN